MLQAFLEKLTDRRRREWEVVHHEQIREKPPQLEKIPSELDPQTADLIRSSGIKSVYSHQAEAIRLSLAGRNVVLSTSTASGKTLAYQAPVIDSLIKDVRAHAIFIFPLKALERDQRDAFLALAGKAGLTAAVYDGDTPEWERRKIRKTPPRVLVTNPDMLHLGLLAYHETWRDFFANLRYLVLDEVHTYKGIFGSHISQVLLRTRRICQLYGSSPRFFASSGTIANPGEFVSRLFGEETAVVAQSGAPMSRRHFLFLRPILSPYTVTARLFVEGLESGLKTIVFTRARKITELITTWVMHEAPHLRGRISSYRAGFLPEERREIETQLFAGKMDGVISTSALEMGIDVGGLDLCLLVGYPGTIINTWQRGGRVGRAGRQSAIVLVAGNDALDQYFLKNPADFFGRNCEDAVLDPRNKEVLKLHLPCAAAENPITQDEEWALQPEVQSVLEDLEQAGAIFRTHEDGSWHSYRRRPQREVDLRGIGESFSIFLEGGKTLIGSSSGVRVLTECHEGAVYLHRAKSYLVTKLDLERRNVQVKPSNLNYYTRALSEKDTEILGAPLASRDFPGFTVREGRLKVTERIVAYEKRRTAGQELIGVVDLDLPPVHFETIGIWIEIPDSVKQAIQSMGLNFMGGIHALEHAAIAMFPLFALCDRDDIGGISTPQHEQVCRPAVFIYDGHRGGVGLAHHIYGRIEELLEKTLSLVEGCPCDDGCPSCIHSPKCGNGNKPLDKKACLLVLRYLLNPTASARGEGIASALNTDLSRGQQAPRASRQIFPSEEFGMRSKTESPLPSGEGQGEGKVTIPKPFERRLKEAPSPSPLPSREGRRSSSPQAGEGRVRGRPVQKSDLNVTSHTQREPSTKVIQQRRIVVFDLETQKLADEVGGWSNTSKMKMSLAVAHTEEQGFLTYTEDTASELIALLKGADLVVGFNQLRFDYEVLRAYTHENLRALTNIDILADVWKILGFRLGLDHLADSTLGRKKLGTGMDAVRWFREGRMDLLEEYCREDVKCTLELFRFGRDNGYLLYKRKDGKRARIPVDWSGYTGSRK